MSWRDLDERPAHKGVATLKAEAALKGWKVERRPPPLVACYVLSCTGRRLVLGTLDALHAAMRDEGITT